MSCEVTFHCRSAMSEGGRKEATKDGWGNNRLLASSWDGARFKPMHFSASRNLSHIEVIFYFHVHCR